MRRPWLLWLTLVAAALGCWVVAARGAEPRRCYTATLVSVERVVDGDTIDVQLSVPVWLGLYADIRERVRLLDVDAWELGDPQGRGPVARRFTEAWLATAGDTQVTGCRRDNFGRFLAAITSRTQGDLAAALLRGGHAAPYRRTR